MLASTIAIGVTVKVRDAVVRRVEGAVGIVDREPNRVLLAHVGLR
jgi:hypothetical protein